MDRGRHQRLEVGCLLWIAGLSAASVDVAAVDWSAFVPSLDHAQPIFAGAVLSFYAYIGFEDMVEVAEEVRRPERTLPLAIITTLFVTALIYLLLLTSTLLATSAETLGASAAPLADVYATVTGGGDPRIIGVVSSLKTAYLGLSGSARSPSRSGTTVLP